MKAIYYVLIALLLCAAINAQANELRIGVLTDGISDFWTQLRDISLEQATAHEVALDFRMPSPATLEQQQELARQLLDSGVKALAICPIKPEEQQEFLKGLSEKTALATLYKDAPDSNRRLFICRDNAQGGALLASLVIDNLPEGLKVMAFCNHLDNPETQARLQGLQKGLQDVFYLEGPQADYGDRMLASANMLEVLQRRPEMACLIGLQEYHSRAMMAAVTNANRARMVRVVGFGNTPELVQGIQDGVIHGLVTDNLPGASLIIVTALKALATGDETFVVPENQRILTPLTVLKTEANITLQEAIDAFELQIPGISEAVPGTP